MKAFEEWQDTQYDGCSECSVGPPGVEWRAALEWAIDDDNNLLDRINKELEEK